MAQKLVEDNFSDIPGALAVHDDIIVVGTNREEHNKALKAVLNRSRERNINSNKKNSFTSQSGEVCWQCRERGGIQTR